jgi:hypothetical protein
MRKWKFLLVNGCDWERLIHAARKILNSCQKWEKFISVLGEYIETG